MVAADNPDRDCLHTNREAILRRAIGSVVCIWYFSFLPFLWCLLFGCVILHSFNGTACHSPQIEAGNTVVRGETAAVFLEQFTGDFPMVIDHAQSSLYGQVAEAENVRALHGEQHQHLRTPYADAVQFRESGADLIVTHRIKCLNIECPVHHFSRGIADISRFLERDAKALQLLHRKAVDSFGRYFPQGILYPSPNRFVRFGGNLFYFIPKNWFESAGASLRSSCVYSRIMDATEIW